MAVVKPSLNQCRETVSLPDVRTRNPAQPGSGKCKEHLSLPGIAVNVTMSVTLLFEKSITVS